MFSHLHESLVLKISVIIFQDICIFVLKFTFQSEIVNQAAYVGEKCLFWPEIYNFRSKEARKVTENTQKIINGDIQG